MAEEVEMTPVAPEPPKANPLAKTVAPLGGSTLKLNPVARPTAGAAAPKPGATVAGLRPGLKLPPKPGATVNALRPGLKLPPKPGATVNALKPGLKLPPKPGATVAALKPGLKLPPKPGATVNALRPGLKLPPKPGATVSALKPGLKLPTKPVIHKPGATVAAAPLPKPVTPTAPAVAKTPTVEGQAITRENTPAPTPTPAPLEQLKSVTQKLKGITQPIPQQAILHKTGIIADDATTEAQKEAAKHKTSRISLSDAMGVAPVKEEHAPMKTIRIKRPIDITTATSSTPLPVAPVVKPQETTAPADGTAESKAETAPAADGAAASSKTAKSETSVTQRKTLRISRPGGAVHPTGKFGLKRPTAAAPAPTTKETAPAAATPEGGVADIADIPEMPSAAPVPMAAKPADDGPVWLWTTSTLVQAAACAVIGTLAWLLYQNTVTKYF